MIQVLWGVALLLALAVCAAMGALVLLAQARTVRAQARRMEALSEEVAAMRAAAVGYGRRVLELERALKGVAEQQARLPEAALDDASYEQAVRMIRKGMSAAEVQELCGLTLGEVELIERLHRLNETA